MKVEEMDLKYKRILFIGPRFHGYENEIIDSLRMKGAYIDFFPEKNNGLISEYSSKYIKRLDKIIQLNNTDKILKNVEDEYDYLFLIRGEILTDDFFLKLFNKSNIKEKIMYQWDSIRATPNILNIVKYFDKVFSFDYDDCKKYNFSYLPLFYVNAFNLDTSLKEMYDFSFIGQFHSDRHKHIVSIKHFAEKRNLKVNFKMKMSPLRFIHKKLFDDSFKDISYDDVIFRKISLEKTSLIVKQSKILIDVVNELQSGLSIRTFEVLGAGKKLLTNNKNIKNEKFYNSNCICIIDDLNEDFINAECSIKDFEEYNIDGWLNKLFIVN